MLGDRRPFDLPKAVATGLEVAAYFADVEDVIFVEVCGFLGRVLIAQDDGPNSDSGDGVVHATHTTMVAPVEVAAVTQPVSEPINNLATVLKSVERGCGERDGQGATPLKTDALT